MQKKYLVLMFMSISIFLGNLPWYSFSAVSQDISRDLGLSSRDIGAILSAYQVGYVAVVLLTGWLADRVGRKRVILWATLLSGIFSTLFVWTATSFCTVLTMRLLAGLAAGAIYVPGMALLSGWFPENQRAGALGAYTGALVASYAGGYFIAAPVSAVYGWQAGILLTSLPVFIGVLIVILFVREKPQEEYLLKDTGCGAAVNQVSRISLTKADYKGPVIITTSYMGHMWELYAFWGWIGPFMIACALALGYPEIQAVSLGGLLASVIILSGVPGVWLMGIAADRWGHLNTIIVCSLCSILAQFILGSLLGRSLTLVMICGLWLGFWVVADSAIFKASLVEMSAAHIRATVLSVQSAAGFAMSIVSPFIFGLVLEFTNPGIKDPTQAANWRLPFVILGLGALLAPLSAFILKKSSKASIHSS